jgi:hypothetical protein
VSANVVGAGIASTPAQSFKIPGGMLLPVPISETKCSRSSAETLIIEADLSGTFLGACTFFDCANPKIEVKGKMSKHPMIARNRWFPEQLIFILLLPFRLKNIGRKI